MTKKILSIKILYIQIKNYIFSYFPAKPINPHGTSQGHTNLTREADANFSMQCGMLARIDHITC